MGFFLILIIFLVAGWFLIAVPRRRYQRSHRDMQDSIEVGNDIITAGGLHGTVKGLEDDLVRLEIAPNVVVSLDRRAVAAVATEIEVEVEEPVPEQIPEPEETLKTHESPGEAG
ncbi:MAG TPA: preprotein translocase subunit YajC [Gaiellaceae bacterium]|nr:preprotein translocase subunit YajC [Gaiellaceae bacterium]